MAFKVSAKAHFAVIGYGSWATAVVKILLENNRNVGWYVRDQEVIDYIVRYRRNPRYLSEVQFDTKKLTISNDINFITREYDVIVLDTPSAFLKSTLEPLTESLKDKFIISAIKGIVPDEFVTVAEYVNSRYNIPFDQIGIITGPSHAEEVAKKKLSYLTMVCKNPKNAELLARGFRCDYIHVNCSADIWGVEYAAILKNIYAMSVGIAVGLGYGDNFIAVLIANGAMEMAHFMEQTCPFDRNINASAYLGDLLVTAYSRFSRNREFGLMIGKGYSVKTAQIEMSMIAEGYYAAECITQVNKRFDVKMPIVEAIYNILYKKADVKETMAELTKHLV